MRNFIQEFKDFIATGNVIELATAVILGAAVKEVIDSFVQGIMMQVIAAVIGQPNFDNVTITLRRNVGTDPDTGTSTDAVLRIGSFLNTLISLVFVGLVLFLIIKAYNRMRRQREVVEDISIAPDIELLTEIRDLLAQRSS
ncbi:large conductance mechanosensitive channel protein MscL [soil metagenome]